MFRIHYRPLRTILLSIVKASSEQNRPAFDVILTINGDPYEEHYEFDDDSSVEGRVEAFEPVWWAERILLGYLVKHYRGVPLQFPIDLGDLGEMHLAEEVRKGRLGP